MKWYCPAQSTKENQQNIKKYNYNAYNTIPALNISDLKSQFIPFNTSGAMYPGVPQANSRSILLVLLANPKSTNLIL